MSNQECYKCNSRGKRWEGYHRLHLAAALEHGALVKMLQKSRDGTHKTGRTAMLVLVGDDVQLFYRAYRTWQRVGNKWVNKSFYGPWTHVATLTRRHVTVKLQPGPWPSLGARQRVNDVLVHRGGGARLHCCRRGLLIQFESSDVKITTALLKNTTNEMSWRDRYYATRWVPVSNTLTFYRERDPEGAKPWRKHKRKPTAFKALKELE